MAKKKKKEEETKDEEAAEAEAAPAPEGETTEGGEGAEGAEGEGAPKKGKKKLFIIIGAVVLLLVIGGVAFMLLGHKKKPDEGSPEAAAASGDQAAINKPVYYELPEFLVNLNATGGHASFIKMGVTLELKDQASVAIIDANKPRITDTFNTYLHELRPEDVQGSAGIYRLKQELMARINGTVQEGVVKDILFSEIIVQ